MPRSFLVHVLVLAVGCAPLGAPGRALAQSADAEARAAEPSAADASGSGDAEARARFEAGRIAYAAARYEDALADFEHAYALSERPELLYNMGQCYDRLRRDADAIDAFARYLAALPDAANHVEVETRLSALREAEATRAAREAELTAAASAPTAGDPASDEVAPAGGGIETEWWLWTLVGLAVVGAGVGIGVGVAASGESTSPPIAGDVGPGGVVAALFSW